MQVELQQHANGPHQDSPRRRIADVVLPGRPERLHELRPDDARGVTEGAALPNEPVRTGARLHPRQTRQPLGESDQSPSRHTVRRTTNRSEASSPHSDTTRFARSSPAVVISAMTTPLRD